VAALCATLGSVALLGAEPSERLEVIVEVDPPAYDGLQQLFDEEARLALANGNYRRALRLFHRLLEIDPHDVRAMREVGRIAHALGDLEQAIDVLGRVDELDGTGPDAELHFLRGESLHALGRGDEAERAFAAAERDLGSGPHDRRQTMWLARIALLRGDVATAVRLYEPLLRDDDPSTATYAEVLLAKVEAHIRGRDWESAERLLREFLTLHPGHERGRALLAWTLEGRGKLREELTLREAAARERTDRGRKTLEYARALERAHDHAGALENYREAKALGEVEAALGVSRLEPRYSPEVGGAVTMRTDPSGDITGAVAGATVPLGTRLRVAVSVATESSSGGLAMHQRTSRSASGWALWTPRDGSLIGAGVTARAGDFEAQAGGSALFHTSPQRDVQLQLRGDLRVPWHESAGTLRDGGVMDTLGATVYMKSQVSSRKIVASAGAQARRLGLAPLVGVAMAEADQLFVSAGVDVLLASSPARATRGDLLDHEMLAPRALIGGVLVGYRHYETFSEDPFGARLVLVERSTIDEVSAVARRVFDRRGRLGGELRGGVGYDWARYVEQWRVGASLLVSATRSSRITLDYDGASESGTGLSGRRHIGSVGLHVDL
jgi:tetratricopeptide (TPR) repeat protein